MPVKLISPGGGSLIISPASTGSNYTLTVPAATANIFTSVDTVNTSMIADSSITASKMAYSGAIIGVTVVRTNTRSSVSTVASTTLFSGSFTKIKADSQLIAKCTVFGANFQSGNSGVGMNIDGSNWDYGVAYQYDGAWSSIYQTTIIVGTSRWSGISAGSHTVGFGWNTFNGGADRPFGIFNPNSSDDSRNQQMASSIILYEVI